MLSMCGKSKINTGACSLGLILLPQMIAPPAISQTSLPPVPPVDDIPEDVLRTEIITQGRSPVTGRPLTATEYEELMNFLASDPLPPEVNPKIKRLIFLLKVRKFFQTIFPFL